ncbi:glucokinase [Blastomonas natatoria]|uniref:Glucokinase n=1 Tax=Blastomonas natatoria TaxID=34015 RepID=A0A2V3VC09_9SPHN|nr:glucokinase [Blastomonas natatoria]PXW79346.1 glucokinase [Blastomonas natatoria]
MQIVTADIGGTHARFALATIENGRVTHLAEPVTLKCAEYASLQTAWEAFGQTIGEPLPRAAAIALATPIRGEVLKMTNNPWVIRPALVREKLNVDDFILINDFGAVAHAVQHCGADHYSHLCGPDGDLPDKGVITVIGPGTGLGVAYVVRGSDGYRAIETEGGHIDYSPLDSIEDAILARLRRQHRRVSVERVCSGPGLAAIYETLASIEGRAVVSMEDKQLWQLALSGEDSLAAAAFDRFCLSLGAAAGDFALAQGANAVVIAGGLGQRIADRLPQSGFEERFVAKGRFQQLMETIPVKLIDHPQPGLFGAAAAFAQEYCA